MAARGVRACASAAVSCASRLACDEEFSGSGRDLAVVLQLAIDALGEDTEDEPAGEEDRRMPRPRPRSRTASRCAGLNEEDGRRRPRQSASANRPGPKPPYQALIATARPSGVAASGAAPARSVKTPATTAIPTASSGKP